MARYIDADALIENVKRVYCTDCNNYNEIRCRACGTDDALDMIEDAPTADVVPKSEVAKIFEELYNSVASKIPTYIRPVCMDDLGFDEGFRNGKTDALLDVLLIIAELKKKYTEAPNA